VPFSYAVADIIMSIPFRIEVMACEAVRPIPIRLWPMVHDERQTPQAHGSVNYYSE
jgi:hypothetical protein